MTTNRPPSCDMLDNPMIKKNAKTNLSDYYNAMPDWLRQRWFNDSLLQVVVTNCAQKGDSFHEMLLELVRCQNSDRDGLRQVILKTAKHQTSFIIPSAFPRRSEVLELLRLVDRVLNGPVGIYADWSKAWDNLRQCSDKLRKEMGE